MPIVNTNANAADAPARAIGTARYAALSLPRSGMDSLFPTHGSAGTIHVLKCGGDTSGEHHGLSRAVPMQPIHVRRLIDHVIVNGGDMKAMFIQRARDGVDLVRRHEE